LSVRLPGPLRFCLGLVGRFPLHLAAAFLAALISDLLLTIQPMFLRAFIDLSQSGAPKGKLLAFPAFMAGAAVLAYLYDFIAVAIRFALQRRVEDLLKEVYLDFGDKSKPDAVRLSLRVGLAHQAQLAVSLALDFALLFARIALILACMALGQGTLALATLLVLAAGLAAHAWTSARLGRLSRATARMLERAVGLALGGSWLAKERLAHHSELERRGFLLRSVDVLVVFVVFRVMPIGALVWFLFGSGLTLGSLTSTLLYVSMLRLPYLDLIRLLSESLVALRESELFSSGLARGLRMSSLLRSLPFGLIWDRDGPFGGKPLSSAAADPEARELRDDMGDDPARAAEKARLLGLLAERARPLRLPALLRPRAARPRPLRAPRREAAHGAVAGGRVIVKPAAASEAWLSRLLGLWLASFAGLLVFLYMALVGWELDGRSMAQYLLK
jgi:hypothetical protein